MLTVLVAAAFHFAESSPDDAVDWVQGIGSLLAVVVAIFMPFYLRWRSLADRHNDQAVKLKGVIWTALTATKQMARTGKRILEAQEERAEMLKDFVWVPEQGREEPPSKEIGVRVSKYNVDFVKEVHCRAQNYLDGEFCARRLEIGSRFSFDLSVLLYNLRQHVDCPPSKEIKEAVEKADTAFRTYYEQLHSAYPHLKTINF